MCVGYDAPCPLSISHAIPWFKARQRSNVTFAHCLRLMFAMHFHILRRFQHFRVHVSSIGWCLRFAHCIRYISDEHKSASVVHAEEQENVQSIFDVFQIETNVYASPCRPHGNALCTGTIMFCCLPKHHVKSMRFVFGIWV